MDIIYSCCKQLVGFAFIFLICGSLLVSEKLRQYCYFFIGICMLFTIVCSVNKLSDVDTDFSLPDNNKDSISTSLISSEEGIKYYAVSLLKTNYKNYSFTVRSHKTDGGNIMLYITCNTPVSQNVLENIYNLLYEKIGIDCKNMNIYLSNNNSGE